MMMWGPADLSTSSMTDGVKLINFLPKEVKSIVDKKVKYSIEKWLIYQYFYKIGDRTLIEQCQSGYPIL